jgi:hypothetical protein
MQYRNQMPISAMIQEFTQTLSTGPMTVQAFLNRFPHQVISLMMLMVSLPSAIPHGIPGMSSVFSLPLVVLSVPLILGSQKIPMPVWLGKLSFREETLAKIFKVCVPYLQKAETLLKPRLLWAISPWMERIVGFVIVVLAIILLLPIPFGNVPPALCVCLLSLGLLAKDGLVVLIGIGASLTVIGLLAGGVGMVLKMVC